MKGTCRDEKRETGAIPCGAFCETTYHIECIYYNARKTDSYGDGYCMKLGGYKKPFENTSCGYWIAK